MEDAVALHSLHFDDPRIESSNNLPHCQSKHVLVSSRDTFTCFLALDRMFSCPLHCSSFRILHHSSFIYPNLLTHQPK